MIFEEITSLMSDDSQLDEDTDNNMYSSPFYMVQNYRAGNDYISKCKNLHGKVLL